MKNDTKRLDSYLRRAREFWNEQELVPAGSSIIIALSGGKDSVCLLRLLAAERETLSLKLFACHVHHGLRKSADAELEFCRKLCEKFDVGFYEFRVDAASRAAEFSVGVEEAGRQLRYECFEKLKNSLGADLVATAHTASDNTETVVMNLVRGGSLRGLSGIPPKRGYIVRPVLCFDSAEIKDILSLFGQDHVTDESNLTGFFRRNRVRSSLIPLMKEENPALDRVVFDNSLNIREETELLEVFLRRSLKGAVSADLMSCDREELKTVCRDLDSDEPARFWIRIASQALGTPFPDSERQRSLAAACLTSGAGRVLQLSDGAVLKIGQKTLRFMKSVSSPSFCVKIPEGKTSLPFSGALVTRSGIKNGVNYKNINKMLMIMKINPDTIKGEVCARNRLPGDSIVINSMHKSAKKLVCDLKLDPALRDAWPVFCDEDGVIWIPGVGLSDRARPVSERFFELIFDLPPLSGLPSQTTAPSVPSKGE
ncbi:MAG: tRNA lysidine(34) synthetase TilS [Clostridia bacterium]|nr:tRNA lysidine(34) synthetase TilS [Clostridia bacterium]